MAATHCPKIPLHVSLIKEYRGMECLLCGDLSIQEACNAGVCVCVRVFAEVYSPQSVLCSHGDGCEGL